MLNKFTFTSRVFQYIQPLVAYMFWVTLLPNKIVSFAIKESSREINWYEISVNVEQKFEQAFYYYLYYYFFNSRQCLSEIDQICKSRTKDFQTSVFSRIIYFTASLKKERHFIFTYYNCCKQNSCCQLDYVMASAQKHDALYRIKLKLNFVKGSCCCSVAISSLQIMCRITPV